MATQKLKVMGVDVRFDPDLTNDARFVYLLGEVMGGEDVTTATKYAKLCDLVFGDPLDVMDKLAAKNGGRVTNEMFGQFFRELLEKSALKNSQRSQGSS